MEQEIKVKLNLIYKETTKEITSSANKWRRFLLYASKFYEYSFENLVFMYAQNRKATMFASLTEWQEAGRYVNPNQNGIVIYKNDDAIKYKYIFDIRQTHGQRIERPWMITFEDMKPLSERLASQNGLNCKNFQICVRRTLRNNIGKACTTAFDRFATTLEEYGYKSDVIDKLKAEFKPLVKASCYYIAALRCGYAKRTTFYNEFNSIRDFSKPLFVSRLGSVIVDEAHKVLYSVEKNLNDIQKERGINDERGNTRSKAYGGRKEDWRDISESADIEQSGRRQAIGEIRDNGAQLSEGAVDRSLLGVFLRGDSYEEDARGGEKSGRDGKEPDSQYAERKSAAGQSGSKKADNGGNEAGGRENSREGDNIQSQIKIEQSKLQGLPDGSSFLSAKTDYDIETEGEEMPQSINEHKPEAIPKPDKKALQDELFNAVRENDPIKIDEAVKSGADIQALHDETTALHLAVHDKKYQSAKRLLEKGASANALDMRLTTPLYDAISANDTDMANLLLDNGADPNLRAFGKSIQDFSHSNEMDELLYYHMKDKQRGEGKTRGRSR
jgi:hypothetical protein